MTFTELELVLMLALAVVLMFNYAHNKLLTTYRHSLHIILSMCEDVADGKATMTRNKAGNLSFTKPENPNGTTQQTRQSESSDRS
jgi:hypothetical protein